MLPEEFQTELNDPPLLRAPNAPEAARVNAPVRIVEIHLIEDVEKFRPELNSITLAQVEVFENREIRTVKSGPADQSPPGIAVGPARDKISWYEGRGVEELRDRIASAIVRPLKSSAGQLSVLVPECSIKGDVVAHYESNRRTALEGV